MADRIKKSGFHFFAFGGFFTLFFDLFIGNHQFPMHLFQSFHHIALVDTPRN